jgi:hypothetical protein
MKTKKEKSRPVNLKIKSVYTIDVSLNALKKLLLPKYPEFFNGIDSKSIAIQAFALDDESNPTFITGKKPLQIRLAVKASREITKVPKPEPKPEPEPNVKKHIPTRSKSFYTAVDLENLGLSAKYNYALYNLEFTTIDSILLYTETSLRRYLSKATFTPLINVDRLLIVLKKKLKGFDLYLKEESSSTVMVEDDEDDDDFNCCGDDIHMDDFDPEDLDDDDLLGKLEYEEVESLLRTKQV